MRTPSVTKCVCYFIFQSSSKLLLSGGSEKVLSVGLCPLSLLLEKGNSDLIIIIIIYIFFYIIFVFCVFFFLNLAEP